MASTVWNYDVFLSFRGTDTRNNFTSHLHEALFDKGIDVFIDNNLERGQLITSQLFQIIEASRISIIVLSENYASSEFCLDEAVKILECKGSKGQIVLPLFYRVNPTHVEELIGSFGHEFDKLEAQIITPKPTGFPGSNNHKKKKRSSGSSNQKKKKKTSSREERNDNEQGREKSERVRKWRLALTEIARLSGWHLEEGTHESSSIKSIVKMVLKHLDRTPLHVADHPVGLPSRVEQILRDLDPKPDAVNMLGLLGMGGIGKTTTAKAIYNRCYNQFEFDGSCFLLNVRENSKKRDLAELQETLLFEVLGDNVQLRGNFDKGINLIKKKLGEKKVLIVIDDVDHIEQLEKLAGGKWFGEGSIIIITTRDSHLLKDVTMVHEIKQLESDEAIELFSWHAFKESQLNEPYVELSNSFLKHAQGLPLAIKVLGSFLYGRSVREWDGLLKKLKRYQNHDVFDILKLSYDGLDSEEKEVFLDIACFLNRVNIGVVVKFFDACEFSGELSVKRLVEKCLVFVDYGGVLQIHNLVQAMGIQIAQQQSSSSPPGKRIFIRDEIPPVFLEDKRSYDIEGMLLDFHGEEEKLWDKLWQLKRLRILIIPRGCFTKITKSLPDNIRWLEWHDCSLKTIPPEFLPAKLVVFNVPRSRIVHFEIASPVRVKNFTNLTLMYFHGCKYLRETMDFSTSPNLERLNLGHCRNLKRIDKSIAGLKKLEFLKLEGCMSLTNLPNLEQTPTLIFLDLNGCSKLDKLPNLPSSLLHLGLSWTAIKEIPSTIGNLTKVNTIYASHCEELVSISNTIFKLPYLSLLQIKNCSKLTNFPEAENSMIPSTSLRSHILDLSGNDFVTLPKYIFGMCRLVDLCIENCEWLVEIPELPPSVISLKARNCKSLENFSQYLNSFEGDFTNCHKLVENGIENWMYVIYQGLSSVISTKVELRYYYNITLPGNEIPEWFNYIIELDNNGSSFMLPPPLINDNFVGIALCAIYELNPEFDAMIFDFEHRFWINNFYVVGSTIRPCPLESKHMWISFCHDYRLSDLLQVEEELLCDFYCNTRDVLVYQKLGVHFIYKQDDDDDDDEA